jgi:hypothetical protein
LADIATAKTHERAMQLLNTPIPKQSAKPSSAKPSSAKKQVASKSESKSKSNGIVAGFKSVIQTVFFKAQATAQATPVQRKTEIRFTPANSSDVSSVEIATSAFQWKRMFMNRVPTGGFMISLPFPPGTHDFKFIVGGVWQCDPSKPIHKTGEHENNYIVISEAQQEPIQEDQLTASTPVSRDLIDTAVYLKSIMEIEACTTSVADLYKALKLVRDHGLVREQIPTHLLNSSDVWTELLKSKGANGKQNGMPLEALMRNLGKLSSLPNFMPTNTEFICARLSSDEDIQKSRIHPFKALIASKIYGMGKALKGALAWTVSPRVHDQLTTTFMRSFKNVAPTGRRYMAALDVSGSMSVACMGCPAISCRQASAALAHILYETEPHVYVRGFTSSTTSGYSISSRPVSPDDGFRNFDHLVRRGMTLDQFIRATDAPYGATDCSLPMLRAIDENLDVDVFIIMTDNETFAGKVHPQVALENYRKHANKPDAKLIVVGMTANSLTIADPNDRNTLNLAGFDASMPEIIAMFVRGEL